MKRFLIMTLACVAVGLIGTALARSSPADSPKKEMAVVDLADKTKLMKDTLRGKYIFVHDTEKMAQGQPCFYVYSYSEDSAGKPEAKSDKLVLSFHCQHVERAKANQLILTYGMVPGTADLFEIREIQFAGSAEGHRVPAS